jgi:predicted dehydrogenase
MMSHEDQPAEAGFAHQAGRLRPGSLDVVRWGILGPGSIAHPFAEGLKSLPDAQLMAVGSRDAARADAFGEKFGIRHRHGSYQALVEDPEVDVIYVATPHPMHKDHCVMALEAGKAVLSEKPITINAAQAEAIARASRQNKRFAMEGHWSRFVPIMDRVRALLQEGAIGEVRMVEADFGFRAGFDPKSRLFDPELGGGALLDVGCYTLSFASMVLGTPDRVSGLATLGETGVDEQAVITLGYPNGALALLSTAVRTNTPQRAAIIGAAGRILIHSPWWHAQHITVVRDGRPEEEIHLPTTGTGFQYEAACVQECLRTGKLQCDLMPLDESIAIQRTMDTLRAQWGVKYPMED